MQSVTPLDLDGWAARDIARRELPALMTCLVLGRGVAVRAISFPAYESTNEGGWDGQVTSEGADPWVPNGQSYWELSCQSRDSLKSKASSDYLKRLEQTDLSIRQQSTFVFVTARKWPGKNAWRKSRAAEQQWSKVLVYDADDLADWLGQAPAARAWLSEALGRSADNVCSLDHLWVEWAGAAAPMLKPSIFNEALTETGHALRAFLDAAPTAPFVITGENRAESAAFVAAALRGDDYQPQGARAVVARTTAGLQSLKASADRLVVLVTTPEVELALGDLPSRAHVIIAADRSAEDAVAGANIQPLTWRAFSEAMDDLEVGPDERSRLELESGYRIGVLRRRLSHSPAVRSPAWSRKSTPDLVGLALAAGWFWKREGDREVIRQLTHLSTDEDVEAIIRRYAAMADAPIFAVADAGGVISRHDAFGALRTAVTRKHLESFFRLTTTVLLEVDPSLELPKDQRWYASVLGKERRHSGRLRQSMAETAAFLAVVGKSLFGSTLAFDCEQAASRLVRDLLGHDDQDRWLRVRDVLKALAEAAPDAFLDALECDLPHEAENRGVWQAIEPVEGTNHENYRATLCWALERLAWHPDRFPRVAKVLAHLSTRPLNDNWLNKPSETLYACFHPFLPQTAASAEMRGEVLLEINRCFPAVAWPLALRIVDQRLSRASYSNRPTFRLDAKGSGRELDADAAKIGQVALDLLLDQPDKMLGQILDLVEKSPVIDGADADRLWSTVEAWAQDAPEPDLVAIRERIRRVALWRRRGGKRKPENQRAQRVYDLLQVTDPRHGHAWLFKSHWLEFGSDELWDEDLDHAAREKRVAELREAAVREIWSCGGLDAVLTFALEAGAPDVVGNQLAKLTDCDGLTVAAVLPPPADGQASCDAFVRGYLVALEVEGRQQLLGRAVAEWGEDSPALLALLLQMPTGPDAWRTVDQLSEVQQQAYWGGLNYLSMREEPEVSERICREMLRAGRATVAFRQARYTGEDLSTSLIQDILHEVAFGNSPAHETGPLQSHDVASLFEILDGREDVDLHQARRLEFAYAQHFHDDHGRKLNFLSRALADEPDFLAEGTKRVYRRTDGQADPDEDLDPELAQQNATQWYHVVRHTHLPPAADVEGEIDPQKFDAWMQRAHALLTEFGRVRMGENSIGQMVGQTIKKSVDIWPSLEVAKALEPWVSDDFAQGLYLGIVNSRGVVWRGNGGEQERVLSENYRKWVKPLLVTCPKLARAIEEVAKSYDRQADAEDREEDFRRKAGSH